MATITLPGEHAGEEVVAGIVFVDGVAHDVQPSTNATVYLQRLGATISDPLPEADPDAFAAILGDAPDGIDPFADDADDVLED